MPSQLRQKRVADRLQREVSHLIQQEMNDPRLALVTVTVVNVDRELEYANIFVSTVGDAARRREVMQVLNNAKGFIRREVARRVQLRRAPELIFHWDPSPEKAEHIAQLLDDLKAASRTAASPAPPEAKPPDDDPR
ncbi:MAG: 30S ribosome-binding factor RbfA [Anaerolineales bacterium]|nr:30S ribosome-binding factor RbfA [Anaerolineales bacterium]